MLGRDLNLSPPWQQADALRVELIVVVPVLGQDIPRTLFLLMSAPDIVAVATVLTLLYNFSLSSMKVVSSALQSQGIPVIQYTLKHLEGKIWNIYLSITL